MADNLLGVIGGSGLYQMDDLKIIESQSVSTPFGDPSSELVIGELNGVRLAFLPRHGLGHMIPPSEINFRANIFALKKIGVDNIEKLFESIPEQIDKLLRYQYIVTGSWEEPVVERYRKETPKPENPFHG